MWPDELPKLLYKDKEGKHFQTQNAVWLVADLRPENPGLGVFEGATEVGTCQKICRFEDLEFVAEYANDN